MSPEDYTSRGINEVRLSPNSDYSTNPGAYKSGKRDNRLLGEPKSPALPSERTTAFRHLKNRGLLIYLTAVMSVAPPSKLEKLEAAEIPPNSTWDEGINVLHKGLLSDANESYGLLGIDGQNKRSKWIIRREGKLEYVDIAPEAIAEAAEREMVRKEVPSITLCDVHDHTLYFARSDGWISDKELQNIQQGKQTISIPPSGDAWNYGGDVSPYRYGAINSALDKVRNRGVAIELRFAVIDAAGIIYYSPINDEELKQEYPNHYQHVQQDRALRRVWDDTIKPPIDKFDATKIIELHNRFIGSKNKIDPSSKHEALKLKRQDIINRLLRGGLGYEDISRELLADQQNGQKLQEDFNTMIIMRGKDTSDISNARINWTKKSLIVSPEQLSSTREYTELRESYAKNGTKIRFIPYLQIPKESPCAGTGYMP